MNACEPFHTEAMRGDCTVLVTPAGKRKYLIFFRGFMRRDICCDVGWFPSGLQAVISLLGNTPDRRRRREAECVEMRMGVRTI